MNTHSRGSADHLHEVRTEWRRTQIIEAATTLFERQGFHATTMQAIASAAGISVGLIYQYVSTKEELLLLVIRDILDSFGTELPAAIASRTDPVERLAAGFEAFCQVLGRRRHGAVLAYRETKTLGPQGRATLKQLEVAITNVLAAEVEAAVAAGLMIDLDPNLVAFDLVYLAHAWALKHWHLAERMPLREYVRFQLGMVLRAVLRPERRDSYAKLWGDPYTDRLAPGWPTEEIS